MRSMERAAEGLAREEFDRLPRGEQRRAAEAYDSLRERARLYRWYLVVQREALGLFRHEDVDRHYPLPEPLAPSRRRRTS